MVSILCRRILFVCDEDNPDACCLPKLFCCTVVETCSWLLFCLSTVILLPLLLCGVLIVFGMLFQPVTHEYCPRFSGAANWANYLEANATYSYTIYLTDWLESCIGFALLYTSLLLLSLLSLWCSILFLVALVRELQQHVRLACPTRIDLHRAYKHAFVKDTGYKTLPMVWLILLAIASLVVYFMYLMPLLGFLLGPGANSYCRLIATDHAVSPRKTHSFPSVFTTHCYEQGLVWTLVGVAIIVIIIITASCLSYICNVSLKSDAEIVALKGVATVHRVPRSLDSDDSEGEQQPLYHSH